MSRPSLRSALLTLGLGFVLACGGAAPAAPTAPQPAEPAPSQVSTGTCDEAQTAISKEADQRAAPYGIIPHLEKNFADLRVAWLMKEAPYQTYVVQAGAKHFGRCNDTGCYLFAAPAAVIEEAVRKSMNGAAHDPALLGAALGLPAANMEGPLRMMVLDLKAATSACVRLPVESDPGVWKCQTPEDKDCFQFGGYTSGGVPEVMILNAPVAAAQVTQIP